MARGRFLSKEISEDETVDALSCDTARLLFTWMIPHADVDGRLWGEPRLILTKVFYLRLDVTEQQIDGWLDEMHELGLIERYTVNGRRFCWFPNWEKHQKLRRDREAPSRLPPPPTAAMPTTTAGLTPGVAPGLTPGVAPAPLQPQVEVKVKDQVYVAPGLESDGPEPTTPPQTHTPTTVGEKPPYAFIDRTDDQKAILRLYQDTTAQVITSSEKRVAWLDDMTKSAGKARMESLIADLGIEIRAGRVLPYNALQWLSDSLRPVQGRNGKRPTPPPNISDMPDFGVTAT